MYCSNCGVSIPPDARFCAKCGKPAPQPDAGASPPNLSEPAPVMEQPAPPLTSAKEVDPDVRPTEPTMKVPPARNGRTIQFFAAAAAILCLLFGLLLLLTAPISIGLRVWALLAELCLALAFWKRSKIRSRTLFAAVLVCTVLFAILLGVGASERAARLREARLLEEGGSSTSQEEDVVDQVTRSGFQLAPQNPENLTGRWKGVGPDISVTVEVVFDGDGEFQMMGGPDEGSGQVAEGELWMIHGPYTVDNSSWPMKITVVDGNRRHYFAVSITEHDKMALQEIDSPEDPLNAGKATQLLRML